MMDIVKDSIIFDLGYLTGSLMNTGKDLGDSPSPDFASYYASKKSQAEESLKKFLEDYAGLE